MSEKPEFKLFYWPGMLGRGEFMRLLFHETQTPYEEVFKDKSFEEAKQMGYGRGKKHFAFPVIEHGDIVLSQTPVICRYLGKKLDHGRLYPKTEKDRLQAEVLMAGVVDVVEEGCRAWHPIDYNATYDSQKEQAKPFIEYYKKKRLPRWLDFFETTLKDNYSENGELVFVGKQISWVDLCIFHFVDGNMLECPELFNDKQNIHLKKFHQAIRDRPNIKTWYYSDARPKNTQTIF